MNLPRMWSSTVALVTTLACPLVAQDTATRCPAVRAEAKAIRGPLGGGGGKAPSLKAWVPFFEQAPPGERGLTVQMDARIDEKGRIIPHSIRFIGLRDSNYEGLLRTHVAQNQFTPATYYDCDVEGSFSTTFEIKSDGYIRPPAVPATRPMPNTPLDDPQSPKCVEIRRLVAEGRERVEVVPPTPLSMVWGPLPAPRTVTREYKYTVRVGVDGAPIASTATVTGLDDARFRRLVISELLKTRYKPASSDNCAVEGTASVTFTPSIPVR